MSRNELIAQLAAETSTTRAAVERMAGAVFSAIGDALARGEPAAIARGSGRSPSAAAPRAVAAIPEPESPSTSPPPGRRRSRPRRPFETRSTPSMAQAADRYRPRPATFVAGKSLQFRRISRTCEHLRSTRTDIEMRPARPLLNIGRFKLAPPTAVRVLAQGTYRTYFRGAYGVRRSAVQHDHAVHRRRLGTDGHRDTHAVALGQEFACRPRRGGVGCARRPRCPHRHEQRVGPSVQAVRVRLGAVCAGILTIGRNQWRKTRITRQF